MPDAQKGGLLTRPTPARKTRLVPGKAAASEGPRRYKLHFVWAVRPYNGSWRTEKPLQPLRPSGQPFPTLRV